MPERNIRNIHRKTTGGRRCLPQKERPRPKRMCWRQPSRRQLLCGSVLLSGVLNAIVPAVSSGAVWATGENNRGQLGDGSTIDRNSPAYLYALDSCAAISAGHQFTVYLQIDGQVFAAGKMGSDSSAMVLGSTEIARFLLHRSAQTTLRCQQGNSTRCT